MVFKMNLLGYDFSLAFEKIKSAFHVEIGAIIVGIIIFILKKISNNIKSSIPMWFNTLFTRRTSVIAKIHIILRKLLYRVEGDRALLFIFSGGEIKEDNDNLLISCVNEVVEDGVSISLYERKKINVRNFGDDFLKNILKNEVVIYDKFPNENSNISAFFMTHNTKKAYLRLLNNQDNKIYGFICIEFCRENNIDLDKIKKELEFAKIKLSLII